MNLEMMGPLYANTVYKEMRNRFFLFFLIVTILISFLFYAFILILSTELNEVFPEVVGEEILSAMFLTLVMGWNLVLGLIFGISCFRSDISMGVMGQILSFPFSREKYFFARIFGVWSLLMVYYITVVILTFLLYPESLKGLGGIIPVSVNLFFSFFASLSAIILGAFFSLYFGQMISFVLGLFTLLMTAMAVSYIGIQGLDGVVENLDFFKILSLLIAYALPRATRLDDVSDAWMAGTLGGGDFFLELFHFCTTTSLLFFVTMFLFKRKSF